MLLIGQSLELSRGALIAAVRDRDAAPILARARRQIAAGARAIDINGGALAGAADLASCARLLAAALPGLPLFVDTASPTLLRETLEVCAGSGPPDRLAAPLVANSLAAGDGGAFDADALAALDVAARRGAGIVISPRLLDGPSVGAASVEHIAGAGIAAALRCREIGVSGPIYLDALAFPPLSDAARCARSLAVLRAWRDEAGRGAGVVPLAAVGNVGFGVGRALASALRAVYAAAAVGAGAMALILPVEEPRTLHAVRLATGDAPPTTAEDRWLVEVARAGRSGGRPFGVPPAPEAIPVASVRAAIYAEAVSLILGA